MERVRPTFFSAVPTIYAMLTGLPAEVRPDTSSLRCVVCGAAPMPAATIHDFEDRYGVPILEGYGLRVVGDDQPLPSGQAGEVTVRGPNVTRGYLDNPEDTAHTLRGGWLHTGDVGRFDEDGYLVLVDRVKDMIIRGGENIYPKEIEDAVNAHLCVLEAAVVGRPDPLFGEEPVAFVALRPGLAAEPDELIEHCKNVLAKFEVPRAVFIETTLSKTAIGEVAKPDAARARLISYRENDVMVRPAFGGCACRVDLERYALLALEALEALKARRVPEITSSRLCTSARTRGGRRAGSLAATGSLYDRAARRRPATRPRQPPAAAA